MQRMVRALYRAAVITGAPAPHDRVNLKIYYPALYGDSAEERNSGVLPPDDALAPFPVVILLPGINLGPEGVAWLALRLAAAGYVTVATSAISEEMPGYISISPGLGLEHIRPDTYGREPSCTLLQPVLGTLAGLQADSPLAGRLELGHIALGGHSAGGTAALINASPEWCPGLRAVFSYAAHTGASTLLGWPAETILPLPASLPTLLLGGDRDGVIAASAHRYGSERNDPLYSISRTFEEAVPENGSSYLMILRGANHFSFAHPHDGSTGREFLDRAETGDPQALRSHLGDLVQDFLDSSLRDDRKATTRLRAALDDPRLARAQHK